MKTSERAFALQIEKQRTGSGHHNVSPGLVSFPADGERESLLYVPRNYGSEHPCPLMVLFHGANGDAREWVELFRHVADCSNIILLAPSSAGLTWDLLPDEESQDAQRLEVLLSEVFNQYSIDSSRVAAGGFSDGASYALAIGLVNPEIFTHVIAFSPGCLTVSLKQSGLKVFIAHGTQDEVLPIAASRQFCSRLMSAGYAVDYTEFESGHRVPLVIAHSAVEMFLRSEGYKEF